MTQKQLKELLERGLRVKKDIIRNKYNDRYSVIRDTINKDTEDINNYVKEKYGYKYVSFLRHNLLYSSNNVEYINIKKEEDAEIKAEELIIDNIITNAMIDGLKDEGTKETIKNYLGLK